MVQVISVPFLVQNEVLKVEFGLPIVGALGFTPQVSTAKVVYKTALKAFFPVKSIY